MLCSQGSGSLQCLSHKGSQLHSLVHSPCTQTYMCSHSDGQRRFWFKDHIPPSWTKNLPLAVCKMKTKIEMYCFLIGRRLGALPDQVRYKCRWHWGGSLPCREPHSYWLADSHLLHLPSSHLNTDRCESPLQFLYILPAGDKNKALIFTFIA